MRSLLDFCEAELPWLLETASALVVLESPTPDKTAVDACGRELASRLEGIGARVQILPRLGSGDHLLAEFGCGERQVLILGHFDTVWPVGELRRQPLRQEEGRLYGPGVYDMKAALAVAMLAIRAVQASAEGIGGRVTCLFTSDEETGSASSRAVIEDEALRSVAALVLEPSLPGGAVKTWRKGGGQYLLRARGIAAHAGVEPEKGASAIHELAYRLIDVLSLQDPASGLTVNVGTISGGTRGNVCAEEACATIDIRVASVGDAARVDTALRALRPSDPRVTLDIEGGIDRPPMERSPSVVRLYEEARAVAAALGTDLGEGGTGGGSDGNFTAATGVPTLDGLGAIGGGAHALGEYVDVASLPWRAALVAGLIRRILAGHGVH